MVDMSEISPPVHVTNPSGQRVPVVFASPHSGRFYPQKFLDQSKLDPLTIRRSEDSFIDLLFEDAPQFGALLVKATYPRAYIDLNRRRDELDPQIILDIAHTLSSPISDRVKAGLGVIPRTVGAGLEIYKHPITRIEAENRLKQVYDPYHATLSTIVQDLKAEFGYVLLIDCHSMPTQRSQKDQGITHTHKAMDGQGNVVLGDLYGTSCDTTISDWIAEQFHQLGYNVSRNTPYAGGFCTRHFGNPEQGFHALQIELARSLYMDEMTMEKTARFSALKTSLTSFAKALCEHISSLTTAYDRRKDAAE